VNTLAEIRSGTSAVTKPKRDIPLFAPRRSDVQGCAIHEKRNVPYFVGEELFVLVRSIRFDERFLHARRRGGIVVELERVETLAARERLQRRGVVDEADRYFERPFLRWQQ
jgi:hypothetical protein